VATERQSNGKWYPPNIADPATHDAFRQVFDRLYALQDTVGGGKPPSMGSGAAAPTSAAASLTPSMMVEAPTSSSAPGVLNTFYADGSYIYVYTRAGWRRAALSAF
jgi:hypothetical protein